MEDHKNEVSGAFCLKLNGFKSSYRVGGPWKYASLYCFFSPNAEQGSLQTYLIHVMARMKQAAQASFIITVKYHHLFLKWKMKLVTKFGCKIMSDSWTEFRKECFLQSVFNLYKCFTLTLSLCICNPLKLSTFPNLPYTCGKIYVSFWIELHCCTLWLFPDMWHNSHGFLYTIFLW